MGLDFNMFVVIALASSQNSDSSMVTMVSQKSINGLCHFVAQ
jgi:hypothetical protein